MGTCSLKTAVSSVLVSWKSVPVGGAMPMLVLNHLS